MSQEDLRVSARAHGPIAADRFCAQESPSSAPPHDAVLFHCPDNQADDIWPKEASPSSEYCPPEGCSRGKCSVSRSVISHGSALISTDSTTLVVFAFVEIRIHPRPTGYVPLQYSHDPRNLSRWTVAV